MPYPTSASGSTKRNPLRSISNISHPTIRNTAEQDDSGISMNETMEMCPNLGKNQELNRMDPNKVLERRIQELERAKAADKEQIESLLRRIHGLETEKLVNEERIKSLEGKLKECENNLSNPDRGIIIENVHRLLEPIFTKNQIDKMLGLKKPVNWTNEEFSKGYALRYFSASGYDCITKELKYPLPRPSCLRTYAARLDMRQGFLAHVLQECPKEIELASCCTMKFTLVNCTNMIANMMMYLDHTRKHRDLVGNIVTSITVCLIISQAADLVRIFTEFSNHVSFVVADSFFYISMLAAFFWLNSMGYYIWKTFRARNVFLRVTDGRKYCWYSAYAWGATGCMAGVAIFSHFFLDGARKNSSIFEDQDNIGWLGIAVFFTPIAFIILINIFFYVTTLKFINRMNTYGRIHHKLKNNFVMFSLLFLIMTTSWLFLILSWLHYDALLYTHIVINALQAPFILYVCVLRQKHVTFLLKKSCCYNEPPQSSDWGDEMTYMNGGDY